MWCSSAMVNGLRPPVWWRRSTATVKGAREGGTRFHGVQIGNRGRTGLHAVCDLVHIFQDWATAGGWMR